jgi:hypothetical protein
MSGIGAFRAARPAGLVCAVVLLFLLALAPTASASGGEVAVTPTNPVVGDTVTVTNTVGGECPGTPVYYFTITLAGASSPTAQSTQGGTSFSTTLPTAGTYTASIEMSACTGDPDPFTPSSYGDVTFAVNAALSASIATSPTTVILNQPVTFSATPDGGNAPYSYAWDLTDSGTFTAGSEPTPFNATTTFSTLGEHTIAMKISDTANGGNVQHTATITDTVDVVEPTSSTPPPPPPTCYTNLSFQLSEFTTTGCFTQSTTDPNVYTTRSDVKFNGATLTGYGQTFTVTEPTNSDPGGHFTAPNSTIAIGGVVVFSGNIDWSLPQGGAGDQALAASFTVATGYQFLNLSISGTVSLTLGQDSSGNYYSDYGLNLQLPAGFSAGPSPSFGSVSGGVAIKVEDSGKVDFGGVVLDAQNVWMGSLQVENACFAYVPADGNQGNNCPAVSATSSDAPIISCSTNPDASYWAASVTLDLPSGLRLGASGSIVGGKVGSFAGVLGNLGRTVPITAGFFLDHIAFGMCLEPPPLVIAANVGVNFLGSNHAVSVEGGFTYTDSTPTTPWSIEINGAVSVADTPIGTAQVGFDGNAIINFGVQAGFTALDNVASLNGDVYGWINAPEKEFVVGGDIKGCLGGVCAGASAEFSSTGVAGCVTVGGTTPTYDLIIPLDGSPPYLDQTVHPVTAGFGYVWGNKSVDLLGGSCDFSNYEPADAFSARAADGTTRLRTRIASGTEAVALRIHGTHGPPQIIVRGPHGVRISSPATGISKRSKGHYLLIENRTDGTADLMLVHPAAGTWTVSQEPRSRSSLTTMDHASLELPPTFGARVKGSGTRRVVQVAYAVPVGARVRLVEHAKGVEQTIAANLRGHRCPGLPVLRPHTDERILCANVRFTPSLGRERKRQVVAVVSHGAIPLLQKAIASFTAPPERLPSRVAAMRVQRGSGDLVVAFARSSAASHYAVSAKLTDGRELAYYLGASCHALKIARVPAGVGAAVKIAGVRYDLKMGRSNAIAIKPDAKTAGSKSKKLKKGKVCS